MTTFLVIAALLVVAALALLALPLLRDPTGRGTPARWSWVLASIAVVALAAGLYSYRSNWNWAPASEEMTPANMVSRLARRLEKQPDDVEGWLLLGRSYTQLEQHGLAAKAYQRADNLSPGRNVEALTGLAEALILSGQGDLAGRPGQLFEQALALQPDSIKALFYSAAAALERGEFPLAQTRFERLLAGNPPEQVRDLIRRTLEDLRQRAAVAQAPVPGAANAAVVVPVRIEVAPAIAAQVKAGAPLFLVARQPGVRGPPLAAKRLEARFPLEAELSATDAMMGGAGFKAGDRLEVTARVANQGGALARSGDPYGTVQVTVGQGGRIAVRIDSVTP
jgi:cytochrome c-type biogenesis protein CcmH